MSEIISPPLGTPGLRLTQTQKDLVGGSIGGIAQVLVGQVSLLVHCMKPSEHWGIRALERWSFETDSGNSHSILLKFGYRLVHRALTSRHWTVQRGS